MAKNSNTRIRLLVIDLIINVVCNSISINRLYMYYIVYKIHYIVH
jgi:hypothetical protein